MDAQEQALTFATGDYVVFMDPQADQQLSYFLRMNPCQFSNYLYCTGPYHNRRSQAVWQLLNR